MLWMCNVLDIFAVVQIVYRGIHKINLLVPSQRVKSIAIGVFSSCAHIAIKLFNFEVQIWDQEK